MFGDIVIAVLCGFAFSAGVCLIVILAIRANNPLPRPDEPDDDTDDDTD
jgi:hypothetical protein